MRHPAFSALCDALYFLFRLNAALGHSLGLGITPQRVTINPTRFCDLPCMDILLFSLGNPIVLLPCYFPSPCARTICTLFGRNRRRAHGPCPKRIYSSTCTLPSPHLDLLSYGLGKPQFVFFTYTNTLVLRASFYVFDFVSASSAPPLSTSPSPSPPLSPFAVSSLVSTTQGPP